MTARVQIGADGEVCVRTGKVELGQGLHNALAQIVADEIGVARERVQMLPVDTDSSPDEGVTSGSLSVFEAGRTLRQACAELRASPASLVGIGLGVSSGTGAALPRACVGESLPRLELPDLFAGRAHFIHDLDLPGLLHGRVLHPPQPGARAREWNEDAVRSAKGLIHCKRDGELFGLLAASNAQADAAFERLVAQVQWQPVADGPPDAAEALQHLPATTRLVAEKTQDASAPIQADPLARGHAIAALADADGIAAYEAAGARTLKARYSKPWIAHASIGPCCALACWEGEKLRVWSHSQGIFNLRRDLALAFGIEASAVRVTHVPGAGCYGHNGADDVAFDAAWLARAVPGRPVRLLWSRSDELTHSPFGPAMVVELEAAVDAQGRITRWVHELWSPGHSRRPGRNATPALLGAWQVAGAPAPPPSIDMPLAVGGGAERNAVPLYDFDRWRVRCHSVQTTRRSSALRSLGAFANVFAAESFIDEIAHASNSDPLALRRRHLQHDPRALAVLAAAAERAGWGRRERVDGVGHGLGFARYKGNGAWCAVVAQVQAAQKLSVCRLTIAVDVGLAVNPDGVVNQIEGGAIQATSWALVESAAPEHSTWADYPILRFGEVPAVEVIVMPSKQVSLGAGEVSMGPTGAAIANALFDALGVRVRDLPLTPERIIAAMLAASA